MKKLSRIFLACCILFIACVPGEGGHLILLWTTPAGLKTPESVLFDKARGVLFVSNVNGSPAEKDGNGFISKISPKGEIITLNWVTGLNAPKGMGIYKNLLYVADIDRIAEIDINSARIIHSYEITNATFLNDIAVNTDGAVYVSDTAGNTIYILKNKAVSILLKSEMLHQPNGLLLENGHLLVGTDGRIVSIDLSANSVSVAIDNTGIIDGLQAYKNGTYIISDWNGKVQLVDKTQKKVLLDTSGQKINAADICVIAHKNELIVPTFYDNHVTAYTLP